MFSDEVDVISFIPSIPFRDSSILVVIPSSISSGDAVTDATWSAIYQGAAGIAAQQKLDVSAVTVGLRYDVEPGFALKTDVTWYSDDLNDLNDATLLKVGVNYTF